jgi:hypothetical protein
MTNGVPQPCDTPSDSAMRRRSKPDVKRNAPIQSTPDARGESAEFSVLGGSFGMTNIAIALTINDAPAMTKKTTFQLAYSDIIPPSQQGQQRTPLSESILTMIFPNTCPIVAPPE